MPSPLDAHVRRMGQLDSECITEIRRNLLRFRNDPTFRGKGKRVPLRQFADLCGVSRVTLYNLMRDERQGLEADTRDRILAALDLVFNRGLRWQRTATKAVRQVRTIVPAVVSWTPVMPNGEPPPLIPRRERGSRHDHSHL